MPRVLILMGILLLATAANADTYSWWYGGQIEGPGYPSPTAACSYLLSVSNPWPAETYVPESYLLQQFTRTQFNCYIRQKHLPSSGIALQGPFHILRSGASCPAGQLELEDQTDGSCGCPAGLIIDEITNECVPKPSECESKKGQRESFISAQVGFSMCRAGCELGMESINPFKRTASSQTLFHYTGGYTGSSCSEDSPEVEEGDASNPPPPTESSSDQTCTETVDTPEGKRSTCRFTEQTKDNIDCASKGGTIGHFNDVMRCVASGKGPKLDSTVKEVTTTTEGRPDGSKKETTVTTTTTTNCSGDKACSSSVTVSTNVSHTNADGTKGNSSSSCEGAGCTGRPGDKGKENGKEDGAEESEEQEVPGPTTTLQGKGSAGFGDTAGEWDKKVEGVRKELDDLLDRYAGLFSGAFDLNINAAGASLPCYQIPIDAPPIRTTLDFCPAGYEDKLVYLKYILLACATILAGFIVLKE
jgi:hypothetical protein